MDNGNVFCGDIAMNTKLFQLLGIKYRPIFLENIDEIFDSWKIYIENGGKTIYPAHGDPFDIQELKRSIKTFRPELKKHIKSLE
jgi:glyoxylase-like metal-dependent hydrolase (beta-lactamase superfamily II)